MPRRLAAHFAVLALAGALAVGCGGSSPEDGGQPHAPLGAAARSCEADAAWVVGLRATGLRCGVARHVMRAWRREPTCAPQAGASRTSCLIRSYRCLGTRTDRGIAVSCSRPGRSIAFVVKRG